MNFLSLAKTASTNSNITKRTLENMLDNFSDNIPNIIYAIIVFVIGIYISKIVRRMVSKFLIKYGMSKGVNNFIVYGIYISMLSIISLITPAIKWPVTVSGLYGWVCGRVVLSLLRWVSSLLTNRIKILWCLMPMRTLIGLRRWPEYVVYGIYSRKKLL